MIACETMRNYDELELQVKCTLYVWRKTFRAENPPTSLSGDAVDHEVHIGTLGTDTLATGQARSRAGTRDRAEEAWGETSSKL